MVENREYLAANYTDPSFVKGMIVVIVMVVLAGILTIYSIYYVSMIPKVQEYGKLKAIGSTKRQIRQMVFREGMLVTALALPVGLLISSFLSRWIMKQMITFMAGEDPLMQVAAELVKMVRYLCCTGGFMRLPLWRCSLLPQFLWQNRCELLPKFRPLRLCVIRG